VKIDAFSAMLMIRAGRGALPSEVRFTLSGTGVLGYTLGEVFQKTTKSSLAPRALRVVREFPELFPSLTE
jgi:hypothetical protein